MARSIEQMSDEELMAEATAHWGAVYVADCFGTNDVLMAEVMIRELERRGYEPVETITFVKREE